MKAKDVDFFEKVRTQLQQFHNEFSVLSKGKPDNPTNKLKLRFVNEKLSEANRLLTGEFKPLGEFSLFDDADLPTNSDVVMILSQYMDCLEGWRCAHVRLDNGFWYWDTDDETIRSEKPSRYRKG